MLYRAWTRNALALVGRDPTLRQRRLEALRRLRAQRSPIAQETSRTASESHDDNGGTTVQGEGDEGYASNSTIGFDPDEPRTSLESHGSTTVKKEDGEGYQRPDEVTMEVWLRYKQGVVVEKSEEDPDWKTFSISEADLTMNITAAQSAIAWRKVLDEVYGKPNAAARGVAILDRT